MYYCWYTIVDTIRTLRRQISEGNELISFTVIDHQPEMIIIHINRIDKGFNNVAAEERVGSVTFCEAVQEEKNAVTIHEL